MIIKRLFDVIASALGLLLLAPLLVAISLAIKFESRGPVFFRQERVGRFGQLFRIAVMPQAVDEPGLKRSTEEGDRHGQSDFGEDEPGHRVSMRIGKLAG